MQPSCTECENPAYQCSLHCRDSDANRSAGTGPCFFICEFVYFLRTPLKVVRNPYANKVYRYSFFSHVFGVVIGHASCTANNAELIISGTVPTLRRVVHHIECQILIQRLKNKIKDAEVTTSHICATTVWIFFFDGDLRNSTWTPPSRPNGGDSQAYLHLIKIWPELATHQTEKWPVWPIHMWLYSSSTGVWLVVQPLSGFFVHFDGGPLHNLTVAFSFTLVYFESGFLRDFTVAFQFI
jgi:hypothetical protein